MTDPDRVDSFELPAPTVWPMVVALGVTLGFTGLVTHFAVSVVGVVLALIGGVGWWRNVLPAEHVEQVPVSAAQSISSWMSSTPRSAERLRSVTTGIAYEFQSRFSRCPPGVRAARGRMRDGRVRRSTASSSRQRLVSAHLPRPSRYREWQRPTSRLCGL
jgi:hypothetical protein